MSSSSRRAQRIKFPTPLLLRCKICLKPDHLRRGTGEDRDFRKVRGGGVGGGDKVTVSKMLRISYKDHATNEEVRAKIQQAIGSHEDPLTIVKRRKLR